MLRWTASPLVRHSRFKIPDALPPAAADALPQLYDRYHRGQGPPPRDAPGARELIRAAWRQPTAATPSVDDLFGVLRQLSTISANLERMHEHRIARASRTGVEFHVGEVVRNTKLGLRGVVIGWEAHSSDEGERGEEGGDVQVLLLPDVHDAAEFGSAGDFGPLDLATHSPISVPQKYLTRLPSDQRRVDNRLIAGHFDRFDALMGRFEPTVDLRFLYPGSPPAAVAAAERGGTGVAGRKLAHFVDKSAKALAKCVEPPKAVTKAELESSARSLHIADPDSIEALKTPRGRPPTLIHSIAQRVGSAQVASSVAAEVPGADVSRPLQPLFDALREHLDLVDYVHRLHERRQTKSDRTGIHFNIGDVVRHRKFGFRGAVIGWDHLPMVPVDHWDGVQGLPSGTAQPFYYLTPDTSDVKEKFGSPRGTRYVAQENLEPVGPADRFIDHAGLSDSFEGFHPASGRFVPVQELLFHFPSDQPLALPETARALAEAALALSRLRRHLHSELSSARRDGALVHLREIMRAAESLDDARYAERFSEELLAAHPKASVTSNLWEARLADERQDDEAALSALDAALKLDDTHAETWVRRGAIHLRARRRKQAHADAARAIELEPLHLGARELLGAALEGMRRPREALEVYQKMLEDNPWKRGLIARMYKAEQAVRLDEALRGPTK